MKVEDTIRLKPYEIPDTAAIKNLLLYDSKTIITNYRLGAVLIGPELQLVKTDERKVLNIIKNNLRDEVNLVCFDEDGSVKFVIEEGKKTMPRHDAITVADAISSIDIVGAILSIKEAHVYDMDTLQLLHFTQKYRLEVAMLYGALKLRESGHKIHSDFALVRALVDIGEEFGGAALRTLELPAIDSSIWSAVYCEISKEVSQ